MTEGVTLGGTTYSDTKVAICTPSTGVLQATYAPSLLGMVLYYLQNPLDLGPTIQDRFAIEHVESREVTYDICIGSNIGGNRDHMVDSALSDYQVTHILFIDDDMGFEQDCLNIALLRQKPIVVANYRLKSPPWSFSAKGYDKEGNPYEIITEIGKHDLEECFLAGFGFALIERKVFEAVQRPRFLQAYVKEKEAYSTEDYPFFRACIEKGFTPYVDQMLSKKVWHVGQHVHHWQAPPSDGTMIERR